MKETTTGDKERGRHADPFGDKFKNEYTNACSSLGLIERIGGGGRSKWLVVRRRTDGKLSRGVTPKREGRGSNPVLCEHRPMQ